MIRLINKISVGKISKYIKFIMTSLLILIIVGFGNVYFSYYNYSINIEKSAKNLSLSISKQLRNTMETAGMVLSFINDKIYDNSSNEYIRSVNLHDLLSKVDADMDQISYIFLIDKDGYVINSSDSIYTQNKTNLSHREYFKYLMEHDTDKIYISKPFFSDVINAPTIVIGKRLKNPITNDFIGIIIATIDLRYIHQLYNLISDTDNKINIYFVHENGFIILSSSSSVTNPHAVIDIKYLNNFQQNIVYDLSIMDKKSNISSIRKIEGYPLYLIVSVNDDNILSYWIYIGTIGLIISIFGMILFVIILKYLEISIKKITDVSDGLKRALDHQIELNQLKSRFLSNMSHELRTPLNAIIGFSEIIRSKLFGENNPKYFEYGKHINDSGQHLLCLINDIIDLSKVELGKLKIDPQKLNVNDTIKYCMVYINDQANTKKINIDISLYNGDTNILCDDRSLKQILLNILSNSIKFTPDNGYINITTDIHGDDIVIEVDDNGIGIPKEKLQHLFDPFTQGDNYIKDNINGSGLGLPICKNLIDLNGGIISVDSQIDIGTLVRVSFKKYDVSLHVEQLQKITKEQINAEF